MKLIPALYYLTIFELSCTRVVLKTSYLAVIYIAGKLGMI